MNEPKFALRQLRKSAGFTLAAILTLAVGICMNVGNRQQLALLPALHIGALRSFTFI